MFVFWSEFKVFVSASFWSRSSKAGTPFGIAIGAREGRRLNKGCISELMHNCFISAVVRFKFNALKCKRLHKEAIFARNASPLSKLRPYRRLA